MSRTQHNLPGLHMEEDGHKLRNVWPLEAGNFPQWRAEEIGISGPTLTRN